MYARVARWEGADGDAMRDTVAQIETYEVAVDLEV
jgi:hypothetical protein